MRWLSLIPVVGLWLVAIAAPSFAAPQPGRERVLDSVKYDLASQHYRSARRLQKGALKSDPDDIEMLYLLVTVEQTRILDYESYVIDGKRFVRLADSVIGVLEGELPRLTGRDSLDCAFYVGNTYGGKSVVLAKMGDWLGGIKVAYRSVGLLKSVIAQDSSYHAAYLGIGVFNYYLNQNLAWLPFFGEGAEKGLEFIRRATMAPFPYDIGAKNILCWILIERDQYARADSLSRTVLGRFPRSSVFLRISGCIALWTQKWEKALALGKRLVEVSSRRKPANWSDLLTGYWILVDSHHELGNKEQCVEVARAATALRIPPAYRRISYVVKHRKKIAEIRSLYEEDR